MTSTRDIVQKLWNLCHVLRDDGITYQDYVTELTWLLFLKMAAETGVESELPEGAGQAPAGGAATASSSVASKRPWSGPSATERSNGSGRR